MHKAKSLQQSTEMRDACQNDHDVENLMTATDNVKPPGKPFLWNLHSIKLARTS